MVGARLVWVAGLVLAVMTIAGVAPVVLPGDGRPRAARLGTTAKGSQPSTTGTSSGVRGTSSDQDGSQGESPAVKGTTPSGGKAASDFLTVGSPFDGSYQGSFDGTVAGLAMPVSLPLSFRVTNAQVAGDGFTGQVDVDGTATGTAPFPAFGLQCTYAVFFSSAGTVTTPGTILCAGESVSVSGVLTASRISS